MRSIPVSNGWFQSATGMTAPVWNGIGRRWSRMITLLSHMKQPPISWNRSDPRDDTDQRSSGNTCPPARILNVTSHSNPDLWKSHASWNHLPQAPRQGCRESYRASLHRHRPEGPGSAASLRRHGGFGCGPIGRAAYGRGIARTASSRRSHPCRGNVPQLRSLPAMS